MSSTEKVAIVGMACRLPGADDTDAYWQALQAAESCLSTSDRYEAPYKGGFLKGIDQFDASFFKISPREARYMDPQQRVLMEVAQQAIDDTMLRVEEMRDLNCGVFVSSLPGDYKFLLAASQEEIFNTHSFLGNASAALAGRIAYFYDFNGPALTIDSACSSGISSIHEACLNILHGSCKVALVGSVSIFATDEIFKMAGSSQMLSASGRCSPFAETADGFLSSEGACVLVLMQHSDAVARGLDIYGSIEACGINHDGLTNGLMAPSAKAQARLIGDLYGRHNIDAERIAYWETHGTGTKLGDAIELSGLAKAFPHGINSCYLGASKAVVGHTLVCSGLASIIKVLLMFKHSCIPRFGNRKTVDLGSFQVNLEAVPFPENKDLATVSAFGFTGTNGHIVLSRPDGRSSRKHRRRQEFVRKSYWLGEKGLKHTPLRDTAETDEIGDRLKKDLAELLGFEDEQVSLDGSLLNYGLDSLSAIQLLAPFQGNLTDFGPQDLFQCQSIRELATAIRQRGLSKPIEPKYSLDNRRCSHLVVVDRDHAEHLRWMRTENEGNPVLLLPALNTNHLAWVQQLQQLKLHGYQVHIPLYPGHDGNPKDFDQLDVTGLVDEIAAYVFTELKHDAVAVIGWSLGGCLGTLLTLRYPTLVNCLQLISMAPTFQRDVFEKTVSMQAELTKHQDLFDIVYAAGPKSAVHPASRAIAAGASLKSLQYYYRFLEEFDVSAELTRIEVPTTIVHGSEDSVIAMDDIRSLLTIPHSSVRQYVGHGHFVPITAARDFTDDLLVFLKKHHSGAL